MLKALLSSREICHNVGSVWRGGMGKRFEIFGAHGVIMWINIVKWGFLLLGLVILGAGIWLRVAPDVEMGKRLTENNCGVCHDLSSAQHNEKGPYLWGVVDRPAGVVDFPFSAAFLDIARNKPFIWDDANLERFIANPDMFVPATRMSQRDKQHPLAFEGISSSENRRDVIAYLHTMQ